MPQRPFDAQLVLVLVLFGAAGTFYVAAVHPSMTEPILAAATVAALLWAILWAVRE